MSKPPPNGRAHYSMIRHKVAIHAKKNRPVHAVGFGGTGRQPDPMGGPAFGAREKGLTHAPSSYFEISITR